MHGHTTLDFSGAADTIDEYNRRKDARLMREQVARRAAERIDKASDRAAGDALHDPSLPKRATRSLVEAIILDELKTLEEAH